MLTNYFRIIWRNISRQPLYTILNLSGLAIGVAATLLILLYVHFEQNFDSHHSQADQIYRVETRKVHTQDRVMDVTWRGVPGNLAPIMKEDYPEVKAFTRHYIFFQNFEVNFNYQGKEFTQDFVYNVDSSVFDVFTFNMLQGDRESALNGPKKMVISASMAKRIFGDENPVGKILTSNTPRNGEGGNEELGLMITGVYEDLPENGHWLPQAMISAETDPELANAYFNRFNFSTYVLLHEGVDHQAFEAKLSAIYEKYLDPEREPVLKNAEHILMPLLSIHFDETEGQAYINIFSAIGLLLLLIAMISYVNLTIAQSSKRATEVGLRKVLGSHRNQLIFQFLTESLFFTIVSVGIGIGLVIIGVEYINQWLGLSLDISQLLQPELVISMIILVGVLGILGGSYPAFFLSRFNPVTVLKGRFSAGGRKHPVRKILVGIQFAVVVFVLVCTGMIYDQLEFIRSKDLGFDQEQMISISLPESAQDHISQFKNTLSQSPNIISYSESSFIPGAGNMVRGPISVETPKGPEQQFTERGRVDPKFFETMGIELTEGRSFSTEFSTDSTQGAIINQAFVEEFGLEDPVGTIVRLGGQGNPNYLQVVGVINDFHESSLHDPIQSQLIMMGNRQLSTLIVKIGKDNRAALDFLETNWEKSFPETPLAYGFVDQMIQEEYQADQLRGEIFFSFSLITLFIAFLGLFGLASYLSQQRIKEVGIRKVLGAGTKDLVFLLTRNFIFLLILAAVPAFVFAWLFVSKWLENFAFQTEMNYAVYFLVLLFTVAMTFFTTGFHALRTANMNPVEALRNE